MGSADSCYDNEATASFWCNMNRELMHRCHFATDSRARKTVLEWIDIFPIGNGPTQCPVKTPLMTSNYRLN